jgi:hypothetical protein
MFDEVLVAWSGSARSRAAVSWAVARSGASRIRLVRAIGAGDDGADIREACRRLLDAEVLRIRELRPDLSVTGELVEDDVEPALLDRSVAGTLLVLGSGGPAARLLPHRTAVLVELAQRSAGPIVFVPPVIDAPAGPVVVGIDGTAAGAVAAQVAADEAVGSGRSMIALHVESGGTVPLDWPGDRRDPLLLDIAAHHPHLSVRERMIRGGVAHELLLAATGASLLVLGRHEQPGEGSSVLPDALVHAAAPLLLVREADALRPVGAAAAS